MTTKAQKAEQEEAREELRAMLSPGDTLYTVLRHVSRSGMSRTIDVYRLTDNDPEWLSPRVATACGMPFDERREAIKIGGTGMDMGFAIIYELSHYLWPDGFGCAGKGRGRHTPPLCPSNDHANGDRNYRKGHHHHSGGYALRQRWM